MLAELYDTMIVSKDTFEFSLSSREDNFEAAKRELLLHAKRQDLTRKVDKCCYLEPKIEKTIEGETFYHYRLLVNYENS